MGRNYHADMARPLWAAKNGVLHSIKPLIWLEPLPINLLLLYFLYCLIKVLHDSRYHVCLSGKGCCLQANT